MIRRGRLYNAPMESAIADDRLPQAGSPLAPEAAVDLAVQVKRWGLELGFSGVAITDLDLGVAVDRLDAWLAEGRHGDMDYMANRRDLRAAPSQLAPGALRAICVRVDYRAGDPSEHWRANQWGRLADGRAAAIATYALGRDYHKVLRARLQRLADRIVAHVGPFRHRVCTDSAPVMEIELARKSGLGWRGKHTLLLDSKAGSMFVIGELLVELPLPVDPPQADHCGSCRRCIDVCPTRAITGPYRLDARRCISYLTIEHRASIPEEWRAAIGNRVYGCDDCQLVCPWNKFARVATLPDFDVRHGLDRASLIELFAWSESEFRDRHAGSPILRVGYLAWLRNLAVGLGNAPYAEDVVAALQTRVDHPSELVREHVGWAIAQQRARASYSRGLRP
jgi:epoxyqueuosine reductase